MLPSIKDILKCNPPYLLQYPSGDWSLVIKIVQFNGNLKLTILDMESDNFTQRNITLIEPPFYVAANVWELEYGSVVMTLDHPTLLDHPAKNIWDKWIKTNNKFN